MGAPSPNLAAGVAGGVPILTGLTFVGMVAGTFTITSLAVLASFIIDDLGITHGQLGLIIGADTLFAALFSPIAGRVADQLGGRRAPGCGGPTAPSERGGSWRPCGL